MSKKVFVFCISPSGRIVKGIHNHLLDKMKLGVTKSRRVSDIEWNEEKQMWQAFHEGRIIAEHSERAVVIDMERDILSAKITELTV